MIISRVQLQELSTVQQPRASGCWLLPPLRPRNKQRETVTGPSKRQSCKGHGLEQRRKPHLKDYSRWPLRVETKGNKYSLLTLLPPLLVTFETQQHIRTRTHTDQLSEWGQGVGERRLDLGGQTEGLRLVLEVSSASSITDAALGIGWVPLLRRSLQKALI